MYELSQANSHATVSPYSVQRPEMDIPGGRQAEERSLSSSDQATVASKEAGSQRHKNKQTVDYALKSGLAGGLAACAVWTTTPLLCPLCSCFLGQDSRWSTRPCQDSLSSLESPIREIYRSLVWGNYCDARHQPTRWYEGPISGPQCDSPPHISLWRHKIRCLRAVSLPPHSLPCPRNLNETSPLWLPCRHHIRLLYVPTGNHPGTARIRDSEDVALLALQYMSANIQ